MTSLDRISYILFGCPFNELDAAQQLVARHRHADNYIDRSALSRELKFLNRWTYPIVVMMIFFFVLILWRL